MFTIGIVCGILYVWKKVLDTPRREEHIMDNKMLKHLKCKKEYGEWYYTVEPANGNDLVFPIYSLYNAEGEWVEDFGFYGDMKYYIETGIII